MNFSFFFLKLGFHPNLRLVEGWVGKTLDSCLRCVLEDVLG